MKWQQGDVYNRKNEASKDAGKGKTIKNKEDDDEPGKNERDGEIKATRQNVAVKRRKVKYIQGLEKTVSERM